MKPKPSHQKPGERALAASEMRYRRLFETAKDGILILDAETGMVVDVNPFLIDLLGYSYEQFVGKAIWELGFFRDIVANQDKFHTLQQQEYVRYENLPLETADGGRREVEFVSNVYLADRKKVIQCNIRDITARRSAEKALRGLPADRRRDHSGFAGPHLLEGQESRLFGLQPGVCARCRLSRCRADYWQR